MVCSFYYLPYNFRQFTLVSSEAVVKHFFSFVLFLLIICLVPCTVLQNSNWSLNSSYNYDNTCIIIIIACRIKWHFQLYSVEAESQASSVHVAGRYWRCRQATLKWQARAASNQWAVFIGCCSYFILYSFRWLT